MHPRQNDEFALRAQVQSPAAVLRSATTTAARLLGQSGQVGIIAEGANADIILTGGNPLDSVSALASPATGIPVVIKSGKVVKDDRASAGHGGAQATERPVAVEAL